MSFRRLLTGLYACAGVAVLIGVGGFTESAAAQQSTAGKSNLAAPAKKTGAKFVASPWAVNCQPQAKDQKMVCMLSQSTMVAKSRQRFVTISIRSWEGKDAPTAHLMVLQLPHGLALAAGAAFQVDDKKAHKLAMYTSDAQGVYARIGLTKALLSSLRKGNGMKVNFAASTGRKFVLPVSLKGFSAGFDKLGS